ncbi:hypothetical protein [Xanthomonas hortorum]|uniref:hypothetical protein n=1 Tax=Xanthomonas hortorum TaxID=56454 RepID=UPI0021147106|nr:hypothetical protein [Xanthomonas hortorum]UUE99557.1 hypothetical protein NDY24_07385 [Xanthomonas hortorum pv. pelargonii]UUF03831.1 hypothetical protein NDY25_07670 [Xanthomonas hortorum pv. pelargonii]
MRAAAKARFKRASARSGHNQSLIACAPYARKILINITLLSKKVVRVHIPHAHVTNKKHLREIAVALANHRANLFPLPARVPLNVDLLTGSRRWLRASE